MGPSEWEERRPRPKAKLCRQPTRESTFVNSQNGALVYKHLGQSSCYNDDCCCIVSASRWLCNCVRACERGRVCVSVYLHSRLLTKKTSRSVPLRLFTLVICFGVCELHLVFLVRVSTLKCVSYSLFLVLSFSVCVLFLLLSAPKHKNESKPVVAGYDS